MRQHDHASPSPRTPQRVWLKLVQTLLHLSVLLGGALGLPQTIASAAVAPLQDAQTRGELTLARDGSRAALVNADKRTPDTSPPPDYPPAAAAPSLADSVHTTRSKLVRFAPQLRSKPGVSPFQARAPPRKS